MKTRGEAALKGSGAVRAEVRAFREDFQTVYYCFENGLPPNAAAEPRR